MKRARVLAAVLVAASAACAAPQTPLHAEASATDKPSDDGRAATTRFAQQENDTLGWLAASDPRLAARAGVTAPREVLERIGTAAVLAEDASTHIFGGSLDVFSFKARARALADATHAVMALTDKLPAEGPLGAELRRPALERELLLRLLDEETARIEDESRLGDRAGDLIRAVVATWAPPSTPQEVQDRDVWIAARLSEVRDSLRESGPRTGPPDLDQALYPLERLLAPLQYPRGTAALARLRIALDADFRVVPKLDVAPRIVRAVRVHLGLTIDPSTLSAQFASLEARLRTQAESGLAALDDAARRETVGKARELLFAPAMCPPVARSPVRSMAPPVERAAVCGALVALSAPESRLAAVVALHDEVQLSLAAVSDAPPPRTSFLSHPSDDNVDAFRQMARERPAVALAPALAAQIALGQGAGQGVSDAKIAAWREFGEVPLDILARELAATL